MKILLDTCAFLWVIDAPDKLSQKAQDLFADKGNDIYLSIISLWEIQIKYTLKRLDLSRPPKALLAECEKHFIQILPLVPEDIFRLGSLSGRHGDPFDRMLVCQALSGNMAILTPDKAIAGYKVKTRW
jgi:PIN domain nuclease of toxin-antitoxin system